MTWRGVVRKIIAIPRNTWGSSSVGQSVRLSRGRSRVRVPSTPLAYASVPYWTSIARRNVLGVMHGESRPDRQETLNEDCLRTS
jgi:hypothetical protein